MIFKGSVDANVVKTHPFLFTWFSWQAWLLITKKMTFKLISSNRKLPMLRNFKKDCKANPSLFFSFFFNFFFFWLNHWRRFYICQVKFNVRSIYVSPLKSSLADRSHCGTELGRFETSNPSLSYKLREWMSECVSKWMSARANEWAQRSARLERVSKASSAEPANEWAVQANKETDPQVAQ